MRHRKLTIRIEWITLALLCITTLCMVFTIFFAYNNSLENPHVPALIAKSPQRSIIIFNIASQLTMFSLAELTYSVFDATRWTLGCSTSGVSALAFLALSRTTSLIGVLYLTVGGTNGQHRIWGGQRIFLTLLRSALGIVLLSDVSFIPTYRSIHQIPVLQAGLSPINTTLVQDPLVKEVITETFWWYFPAILADGKISSNVEPLTCSGDSCTSYFLPGPLSIVQFDPNSPMVYPTDYPTATTFIQQDAPGYQLDFFPIGPNDPAFTSDDCRVFGVNILAVQMCLKKTNTSLLILWSSCPPPLQEASSCLNTTDWGPRTLSNTSMTISQRRASTVYNRFNYTIEDIIDLSVPTPMDYTPDDFFTFYSQIFAVNPNETNWSSSVQYRFLLMISAFLESYQDNQIESGADPRLLKLHAFLATPIAIFNDAWSSEESPNMGDTIAVADSSYRLVISSLTLYMFMAGGVVSLLWCYCALGLSIRARIPGTSLFPEVDFASKVASASTSIFSLPYLLSLLSNAGSYEIRKALAPARLYVHVVDSNTEKRPSVSLEQRRPDSTLSYTL